MEEGPDHQQEDIGFQPDAPQKRHPVSTPTSAASAGARSGAQKRLSGAMMAGVIECVSLPAAPKHPEPGPGEDAYCVRMITSTSAGLLVDMGSPTRSVSRIVRKRGEGVPQAFITCPAERDPTVFPRSTGDRRDAGFSGQVVVGDKP